MPSISTNQLIDQAKCIDTCIPDGMKLSVLIVLAAQAAGISTDPGTLINLATCVDCQISSGIRMSVIIALFNQILANGTITVPCMNLIPAGSVYDVGGSFDLSTILTGNTNYKITWGQNESQLRNIGGTPAAILNPGVGTVTTFTTPARVTDSFIGSPGNAVTSIICAV